MRTDVIISHPMATKAYETKQVAICDCGHDYATHHKSLRGKLICVYRDPRNDDPCYCDQFTNHDEESQKNAPKSEEGAEGVRVQAEGKWRVSVHHDIDIIGP